MTPPTADLRTLTRTDLSGMQCSASFSADEAYRYALCWTWDRALPPLAVCMLNPSTATHEVLDPTITGLVKRARAWGRGSVMVANLFALRATDPQVMKAHPAPVGAANDDAIRTVAMAARDASVPLIAAWGAHGRHLGREAAALALLATTGAQLAALDINIDGTPKHPLYVAHARTPAPWSPVS